MVQNICCQDTRRRYFYLFSLLLSCTKSEVSYIFNMNCDCFVESYLQKRKQITFLALFQSLERLMRHPEENRNQIRELAQTLTDGGILDELINEKLEKFNTRWEELQQEVYLTNDLYSH